MKKKMKNLERSRMEFLSALHYNRCEFKKGSVLLE